MSKAIVYSSGTGNTKQLAEAISKKLGVPCAKVNDDALSADEIYVGFWTVGFSCPPDVKALLEKMNNKKVFLFGTAGYDFTPEFYEGILNSVKENINDTNEVIGSFMCQGKVSEGKKEGIKKMDMAKFEAMKDKIELSEGHPNDADIEALLGALV